MKKFIQIVTAAILSVGFIGSVAGAAACNGNITNFGNNSNQTISCNDIKNVTITCNNTTAVANITLQNGTTGTASVTGNGTTGYAISGNAVNTSDNTVSIGTGCGTTTSTTSPSPSVTPVAPGKGATVAHAASLPNTAANDTASIIAVSLVSAAAVVGLSRAGVAAYRRFGNK